MGRVAGKVAFITGAARGQGRAHAVRLAEEGADIIAVDVAPHDDAPDGMAETAAFVEKLGRRVVTAAVDVRDFAALRAAVRDGVRELGRLDIVVANAGVLSSPANVWETSGEEWDRLLGVNLTGVFNTIKAAVPHVLDTGDGGSVILISSTAGLKGTPSYGGYAASKHGVLGLARTLAMELGRHHVRVNSVHPGSVDTPMIINDTSFSAFAERGEQLSKEDVVENFSATNLLPIPWVEARDIANAVLWLASDEARYVTGIALPVDAGMSIK